MKSATIPSLRVTPDVRRAAESVLREGETLSEFAENSPLKQIEFRRMQKEFVGRGLAAKIESRESGVYYSKEESIAALDTILDGRHRDNG